MKHRFHANSSVLMALLVGVLAFGVLGVANNAIDSRYAGSADMETPVFRIKFNGKPHD